MLSLLSSTGEILTTSIGDPSASYTVDLQTKGKHYPLVIEASGGLDLVTGAPLDFTMRSVVLTPSNKAIANINPFTTLAHATARRMGGGLTSRNVNNALSTVVRQFNMGMTSAVSLDPLTTPIDDANLAELMRASEALAEIFRRVAAAVGSSGFPATKQSVIDAIAADLVDGVIDGRGSGGANRRIAATTMLVASQVALETMRNELNVNSQVATTTLDDVVSRLASGSSPELTDSLPVTSYLIDLANDGVDAAIALGSAAALESLSDDLASLQPGASSATARQALPSDAGPMMLVPIMDIAGGTESDFNLVLPGPDNPVDPINSPPVITGMPDAAVMQGMLYEFVPSATDDDGDTLTFSIINMPAWASFNSTSGRLSGTPSTSNVGTFSNIRISVSDGQATVSLPDFSIAVTVTPPPPPPPPPPNTAPTIGGNPPASVVAGSPYGFTPTSGDADGDTLTFSILGRPSWAGFNPATGRLSGTPSTSNVGTFSNIRISVSDGAASANLPAFSITVTAPPPPPPQNTPPTIGGNPPASVVAGSPYAFVPTAADGDGDTLTFTILGRPSWAVFNGTTGMLSGTPSTSNVGTFSNIRISVSDGAASANLPAFSITVTAPPPPPPPPPPPNTAPTIGGIPPASVVAGSPYGFTPSSGDADGDTLTFSILGRPSWAAFNSTTGRLSGTPTTSNVGTFSNIRISVSDGEASANLPAFSITVTAPPDENTPPTIGGNPPASVVVGSPYGFTPSADDDDGDTLTFLIANQPSWASFSPSTGQLSGTPDAGDVGTYSNIRISVSDGEDTVNLPAFSITVEAIALGTATLSWEAPVTNEDGSPLADLDGFRVYWGQASGNYPNSQTLMNPGLTTYIVENLPSGTHYFVVTAINSAGMESDYSNEASKTIP